MDKKHDLKLIKREYDSNKYPTLKELADAHGVSYNYLRKVASKWKNQKDIAIQIVKEEQPIKKKPTKSSKASKASKTSNSTTNDTVTTVPTSVPTSVPTVPRDVPMDVPTEYDQDIPEYRNLWHMRMWDKLGQIVERSLDNPDFHYLTLDGRIKTKALSDAAMILEKVQKGQSGDKDSKATGQLTQYAEVIRLAREAALLEESEPDLLQEEGEEQ